MHLRRFIVSAIRPLAAPLLNRIQLRIETAINKSQPNFDQLNAQLQAIRDASLGIEQKSTMLQLGLDALRLDVRDLATVCLSSAEHIRFTVSSLMHNDARSQELGIRIEGVSDRLTQISDRLTQVSSYSVTQLGRVAIPVGSETLLRTPYGYLLAPSEDLATIAYVYENEGRIEPGTVMVIQGILKKGDCYIDVGANIGLNLLPAARCIGPEGFLHAIEPSSRLQELLRRTLNLNGLEKLVALHPCAAGGETGGGRLNVGAVYGHSSFYSLPETREIEEVKVEAIDNLIAPGTKVRLVKIDVEGFELAVRKGMTRLIADNPDLAIVVEFGPAHLHHAGISVEAWLEAMRQGGFSIYEIDELEGDLRPLRDSESLASILSVNLLLLQQSPRKYPELKFR